MKKTTLILILLFFGSVFNNVWSQGQIYVSGNNTQTTITSNSPTTIAPGLTISSTENITDFTVSVTDSYSTNDAVGYTGSLPSGITTTGWNATKRAIVFKGTKTAEEWQAFLRNLTITTANVCSPETRKVSFIAGETFYNPLNGHFYKVTTSPKTWSETKVDASSDSYYGSQGYLVTLTSAAENTFVSRLIGQNAWMGASDDYLQINQALGYTLYPNQGASEGKWYWVTGPEKGTQMSTANRVNINSVYQNWSSGEPNNYGSGENCLHMYANNGLWNDFPNSSVIYGIREYGDMPGDLTNSTQQFTQDIYIQGSSSGTISGGNVTVCAGSNSTTLTLSGFTGSVVRWESSVDNFITAGTDISNTSTTLTVNNISTTTYYRAVVNSTSPSTCNGLVTSSAPVYVSSAVSGNVFAMNTNICDGSDVDLYLSGQEGEVQKWQRSTDNSTWTDIANTNPTLIETVNTVGTLYYRAFVQVPGCGAAVITPSKSITVVTGTPPQVGTVSSNTHFSATNSGTLTLSGYTGTISKWQRSTDDGLVWIDITNTTSSYNYSNINKETLFRALVANGSCGATYSTSGKVEIIFTPTITDFAPKTAAQGNEVVITGTNLQNVTQVQFEGVDAASFTINSTSKITAIVPSGTTSGDISVTNSGGSDSISGFILNVAPTDIELSSSSFLENNDLNDVVGQFSGTDPDISDTFTFGLVPGTGDTDNESFSISGNNLLANLVFDFETKYEYSVRVEIQDNYGNSYEKTFTINVTDVNENPTDITLDNAVVEENIAIGRIVGVLGAIDEDSANTFTYTLATGDGTNDADNASFTIEGTDLKLAVSPDYETQSTYAIHINVNDGELNYKKAFIITVNNDTDENNDGLIDGAFVTTWQTTVANESITIPTTGTGYSYNVDWGDGSIETGFTADATHTYATAGNYNISISGDFPRIYFNEGSERLKIIAVNQWGDQSWTSMARAFFGCGNLDVLATDAPDLSNVTDMSVIFSGCTSLIGNSAFNSWDVSNVTKMSDLFKEASSFNQDISSWNVGNVTLMNGMFFAAESFNQNIGSWDVSLVQDMSAMFIIATSFNQDISSWNVSNVKNMSFMFERAVSFNQDVGSWDVTNVTNMRNMFIRAFAFNGDISSWQVGNVTDMQFMFFEALAFNQDIGLWDVSKVSSMESMFAAASSFNQDISSWNVGNVTNMQDMFSRAIAFDQDLGSWDINKVTNIKNMFYGVTLSTNNYDNLLLGWSTLENVPSGIIFSGGNSIYCFETSARTVLVDELGWTITDGGKCDTDADGVTDDLDQCPDTPTGETADSNGCSDSQKDSDGDGVNDADDVFPNDPNEDTDSDGDGTGDNADAFPNDANEDTDTDGDGTGNNADAFPNDASENTDSDGDGTGDNADAFQNDANEDTDTDGDGTGDNADAFPNDANENTDSDGDGTGDNSDAFPNDANEDTDTDGDGIGNNADTDDDNDGLLDVDDSEPLNSLTDLDGDGIVDSSDNCPSVANADQSDTDGDGEGNVCDTDDDNDGVPDTEDAFPLDATEDTDTDGDGTGDNADTDDDNDGILDLNDAFPFDSTESVDTDGDGIGNNGDTDDDGDGVLDAVDQFPLDASEQSDADNDGIGDNEDGDDDNDGIVDGNDDFPTDSEPLLVPAQAFTPNGDGNNDSWMVPGIDNYPNNRVSVYNRWGHLVFEANGYSNDWEGFYKKNSEKLPQGSYLYVIDLGEGGAPLRGWIFINY